MPQHKAVIKLLDIAIYHIKTLVKNEAVRVSKIIIYKFVHSVSDDYDQKILENSAIETYLEKQIEAFKEHVFTHIPANLVDKILESILHGINEAICAQKSEWDIDTNIQQFTKAMHAIIEFSQLLILPIRKHLDMQKVPQMNRHCFFKELHKFSNITILILGSISGGWGNCYEAKFLAGLPYMKNLIHFSLKYDCTKTILQVLSDTCWKTLRILDIERSTKIRDDSIDYIKNCSGLVKINIFQGKSPNNFLEEKPCFSLEGQVCLISFYFYISQISFRTRRSRMVIIQKRTSKYYG